MKKSKKNKSVHSIWFLTFIPLCTLLAGVILIALAFTSIPFLASVGAGLDAGMTQNPPDAPGHPVPFFTAMLAGGGFFLVISIAVLLMILSLILFTIVMIVCIWKEGSARKLAAKQDDLGEDAFATESASREVSLGAALFPLVFGCVAILMPIVGNCLVRLPMRNSVLASCIAIGLAFLGFVLTVISQRKYSEEYRWLWMVGRVLCGAAFFLNTAFLLRTAGMILKVVSLL